jgi:hypothetical protein
VQASAVPALLSFLHEMGILLWMDDDRLRDTVVLDAVAFFVTPATRIICKHLSTSADCTRHVTDAHKACNRTYYGDLLQMVHEGVLSSGVVHELLRDCGAHCDTVIALMVKFGLIVPLAQMMAGSDAQNNAGLESAPSGGHQEQHSYLVPALLPVRPADQTSASLPPLSATATSFINGSSCVTAESPEFPVACLLVFTCDPELRHAQPLTLADTARRGFLPKGLFERLLCKVIDWAHASDLAPATGDTVVPVVQSGGVLGCVYQDYAEVRIGKHRISLRAVPEVNCILLGQDSEGAGGVQERVCELVEQILSECMKSLTFFSVSALDNID